MSIISATNLTKNYGSGKSTVNALGPITFEIQPGSFTLILGKSGSGKSTLLNLLTGLDKPTSGELIIDKDNLHKLSAKNLSRYRSSIGIVFQFYNLLDNLNTLENILMGSWASGKKTSKSDAKTLLEEFEIAHRIKANVKTLSGGEKQRVAICRALINKPKILFCDEPTGALDSKNEKIVTNILQKLQDSGITIVMVTHSDEFMHLASQTIYLKDGKIEKITNN
jgi:putative ABC transport system ATP-binding protein